LKKRKEKIIIFAIPHIIGDNRCNGINQGAFRLGASKEGGAEARVNNREARGIEFQSSCKITSIFE
jgi:hypothetical protein